MIFRHALEGSECIEKENKMLHIYSCINSNSGGWLQLGCTEGQTKKICRISGSDASGSGE